MTAKDRGPERHVRVTFLLVLLLGLALGGSLAFDAERSGSLLWAFGLSPADLHAGATFWQVLCYPLALGPLDGLTPLEALVPIGVLLLLGRRLEGHLGQRRYAAVVLLGTVLLAGLHLVVSPLAAERLGERLAGPIGLGAIVVGATLFVAPPPGARIRVWPAFAFWFVALLPCALVLEGLRDGAPSAEVNYIVGLLGIATGAAAAGLEERMRRHVRAVRVRRHLRALEEELQARDQVDRLLDKISREGMESLTRTEKRFLKYASGRFYRRPPAEPAASP